MSLRNSIKLKTSSELRQAYIEFYRERKHLVMPSSSLIPDDPTLLLTNSGMVQFKPYFSGESNPPSKRITTYQKCFRTTDIEEIGDATHLTFFEMLGNFSFGDYFKEESCSWAFKLMTDVLGFSEERLYVTIYKLDTQAEDIWLKLGIPQDRIYRFGDEHNWWGPAGDEGPCGPCSEIHLFTGERVPEHIDRTNWGPNLHKDFIEVYNLVFTQFYRDINGNDTMLPKRNIDTGMGLERTLSALNGVNSVYEVGDLKEILTRLKTNYCHENSNLPNLNRTLRILTDHGRSIAFLISDGVVPSNTGRGYILRRIIRRSMMFAKQAQIHHKAIAGVVKDTVDIMGDVYPALRRNVTFILKILQLEEEAFKRVLSFGSEVVEGAITFRTDMLERFYLLDYFVSAIKALPSSDSVEESKNYIKDMLKEAVIFKPVGEDGNSIGRAAAYSEFVNVGVNEILQHRNTKKLFERWSRLRTVISGKEAFLLHDTYGLPVDITKEYAVNKGLLGVDEHAFTDIMRESRSTRVESSNQKQENWARIYHQIDAQDTAFIGYTTTTDRCKVLSIVNNGSVVQSAVANQSVEVVLDRTPFYARRGGQVGDKGIFENINNLSAQVVDTRSPFGNVNVHFVNIISGRLVQGDVVTASVDSERRERIKRNHTATHLLHAALREVIGQHVQQSGSVVESDYLRFDFTHFAPLSEQEIKSIQQLVNSKIQDNLKVEVNYTTLSNALAEGALAFFTDTYSSQVRTVRIGAGNWSYELCGGTHMATTGGIGAFIITTETGIGTGLRRIFAYTGVRADEEIWSNFTTINTLSKYFNATPKDIEKKAQQLINELTESKSRIATLEQRLLYSNLVGSKNSSKTYSVNTHLGKMQVYVAKVEATSVDMVRTAGDQVRNRIGTGIVVIGSIVSDKPVVVIMATKSVAGKLVNCAELAKAAAKVLKGGGGGKNTLAQAGGKDISLLDSALQHITDLITH